MKTVFDCEGECLGDEWVDLSGLQETTRHAILQMIYLDETVDALNSKQNENELRTVEIVDSCFHAYASSFRYDAKEMAMGLLNT